jgi:Transposase DNA-binding
MSSQIFFPESRKDFSLDLSEGQRYRNSFGDKRLSNRHTELLDRMSINQSVVINQVSIQKSEQAGFYRFLNNRKVGLPELIYKSSILEESLVRDKDVLILQDTTSVPLRTKLKKKAEWQNKIGVIDDNRTPGFYIHCSLAIDWSNQTVLGLGDAIIYTRPFTSNKKEENIKKRTSRRKLSLEQQESYVWALGSSNTAKQLGSSQRVTTVMDQGGDKYEVIVRILDNPLQHVIVRSKEDRQVINEEGVPEHRLAQVLGALDWVDQRSQRIRALNHYSKSSGKLVQRQARNGLLCIRYTKVQLAIPSNLNRKVKALTRPVYVVEVKEDARTVPEGEQPIQWRVLTTWEVCNTKQAWSVIEAYQARWYIEQHFRVLKMQGLCVEYCQLKALQSIKKQAVMALNVATKAMQLVLARDGNPFVPIETMFDDQEQEVLSKINKELEGATQKQSNPHDPKSLAWAAWVIARLGGWKGYANQRPPGPITMKRGLQDFGRLVWAFNIFSDS